MLTLCLRKYKKLLNNNEITFMKLIKTKIRKTFSCLATLGIIFSVASVNAQRRQSATEQEHDRRASHPRIRANSNFCNGADHQFATRGSTFEVFQTQNTGRDACMTVYFNPNERGALRNNYMVGSWSEVDNVLIRESQRPSDTNRFMSYLIDIESRNNVYHGGYGWWSRNGAGREDIVEFYVVEGWNNRADPIFGMERAKDSQGRNINYRSNGNDYQLYRHDNITAGTVFDGGAVRTFTQFKAVRVNSQGHVGNGRFTGSIAWETHFNQMNRTPDKTPQEIFEISYTVEGFATSSEADFILNATFRTTDRRFNFKSLDGENLTTVANKPEVSVSPNPTSGEFVVNTNNDTGSTVQLYDLNGALVLETQSTDASIEMNRAAALASGLYIVKVIGEDGTTSTEKLVIQ